MTAAAFWSLVRSSWRGTRLHDLGVAQANVGGVESLGRDRLSGLDLLVPQASDGVGLRQRNEDRLELSTARVLGQFCIRRDHRMSGSVREKLRQAQQIFRDQFGASFLQGVETCVNLVTAGLEGGNDLTRNLRRTSDNFEPGDGRNRFVENLRKSFDRSQSHAQPGK